MGDRFAGWVIGTTVAWLIAFGLIAITLWRPVVGPWVAEREGMAELARATQNRQILIQQAQAEKEAATLTAEAISIVGQAAKDFPEYQNQMFIQGFAEALKDGRIDQIIYVPTEAQIPIMEAGR